MQYIVVENQEKGLEKAKGILYEEVDQKTVLFLSGGRTPKTLYEALGKDKIIRPAAVLLTDERFGSPMHRQSNELMIAETGFLGYLKDKHIPFYSMLYEGIDVSQAAKAYDEEVRDLFFKFPKSVAVVGIGLDGHTVSIMPNRADFTDPLFEEKDFLYVSHIDDRGKYGKRITLTFAGLSLMDKIIVFVLGKDKQWALQQAFTPGPWSEIPSRFFTQPDIAKKTIFISDQKV